MRIKTFISPVLYRKELRGRELVPLERDGEQVCWFDSLLNGGIQIPVELERYERRPLIWLVSGPPGTGKSTFILELCCKLATNVQPETQEPLTSILYSAESPVPAIRENSQSLGWGSILDDSLKIVGEEKLATVTNPGDFFAMLPARLAYPNEPLQAHVIVIDSLNVLGPQVHWQGLDIFRAVENHLKGKCWLVILVQNWEHDRDHEPSFAFLADIETRLSAKFRKDYLLNYIRIVKIRGQEHARGEHLLKIYPAPRASQTHGRKLASDRIGLDRNEGGVFIMPSIHRHLSALGDEAPLGQENDSRPKRPASIEVPIADFSELVPLGKDSDGTKISGLPKYCCTALVGSRGAMKSHVAYLTLVEELRKNASARGVMLSLRDDGSAAVNTLEQICVQRGLEANLIQQWVSENRLDIVYFAPGYLPPEEFMHRVVVSIEGMVQRNGQLDGRNIFCVLNGIDHLAARHPLCAEEKMFLPALISYLNKALVTSAVIAADDDRAAVDESGLLPMADLLIRFTTVKPGERMERDFGGQITRVFVQRVPAGAPSGASGFLFRDKVSSAVRYTHRLEGAFEDESDVGL